MRYTDWKFVAVIVLTVVSTIALIVWALSLVVEERKQWESFAVKHDCKVVGRISSSTVSGVGVGVMSNGQTGYACNDGITYWR